MDIEYELTDADLQAFAEHLKKSRLNGLPTNQTARGLTARLLLIVFLLAGTLAVNLALDEKGPDIAFAAAFVTGLVVGGGLGGVYAWKLHAAAVQGQLPPAERRAPRPGPSASRLSISPDGVTLTEPLSTLFVRWSGIAKVEGTPDHLFLFTDAVQAFAIPRRAFPDDRHFEQFAGLARRYHEESLNPTGITSVLPGSEPGGSAAVTDHAE